MKLLNLKGRMVPSDHVVSVYVRKSKRYGRHPMVSRLQRRKSLLCRLIPYDDTYDCFVPCKVYVETTASEIVMSFPSLREAIEERERILEVLETDGKP